MGNEERKDNKKVKILTFLLIICVLGFIGYVLVDQGIISFGENKNTTTEKEKEKDDKKEKEESSEED